jgi:hypothetical protein
MAKGQKQRRTPRFAVPGHLTLRARGTREVRLLDLSTGGARIEHLDGLRPGSPCELELPPALGVPPVSAQVAWSRVLAEPSPEGKWRACYQSGLTFVGVTTRQWAALARSLERFAQGGLEESRQGR